MWDLPFNKGTVGFITFGLSAAGFGLIMLAVEIQQRKHGFKGK
jgi:hypothetical protein